MARRNRRSLSSSLELLLDTMCNTFGGVMFIAISLVVVLTMAGKVEEVMMARDGDAVELKKDLAALKKLIAGRMEDAREKERLQKMIQENPSRKRMCELAALESTLEKLRIERKCIDSENAIAALEIERRGKKTAELEKRISDIEKLNSEKIELIKKERIMISALEERARATSPSEISFKFFAPSSEPPYYLLVKENRVWRIGPVFAPDGSAVPESDVTHRIVDSGRKVICTPLPASGVPLLANGSLSPDFEKILKDIPSGRVPDFTVASDSAKDFSEAREILKKRFIKHGISTNYTGGDFIYVFTENVHYEY